jgi:hypothetical protein
MVKYLFTEKKADITEMKTPVTIIEAASRRSTLILCSVISRKNSFSTI